MYYIIFRLMLLSFPATDVLSENTVLTRSVHCVYNITHNALADLVTTR